MATEETKLSLKLLIDTKNKQVLFAEVEKDFVDFLFHILTLPVGIVTKLLIERGMNGCLHNIFESVENLNDEYIKSKDIILKPECPLGISSVPLLLRSDVPTLSNLYRCSSSSTTCSSASDDPTTVCKSCNYYISRNLTFVAPPAVKKCGFVKELVKYIVMDDLVVKPASIVSTITSLNMYHNVKDVGVLQEKVVDFGMEEALKLLKSSFDSNAVLTSLFMSRLKEEK